MSNKLNNNTSKNSILIKSSSKLSMNNKIDVNISDKHLHPQNKQWINSVYYYNKGYLKNLPSLDTTVNNLARSYFNFISKHKEEKTEANRSRIKSLTRSVNKIFVSKPEFKHTNSKVIITFYVYNRQYKYYVKKLINLSRLNNINLGTNQSKLLTVNKILSNKMGEKSLTNNKQITHSLDLNLIKSNSVILLNNIIRIKSLITEALKWDDTMFKHYEYNILKMFIDKSMDKEKLIIYYNHLIRINKFKYENIYLVRFKKILETLYNKKVDINLINLKRTYLNTDILLEMITFKLKSNKSNLLSLLGRILNSVKINSLNKIMDIRTVNKSKILLINTVLPLRSYVNTLVEKSILNNYINNIFDNTDLSLNPQNVLVNYIKYKTISGLKLQAKGRLTKRSKAERSISKNKYKGGLKNIDSSYKGLSSIMIRGHEKANIQHSKLEYKNRNGSFGLKGWLSNR